MKDEEARARNTDLSTLGAQASAVPGTTLVWGMFLEQPS